MKHFFIILALLITFYGEGQNFNNIDFSVVIGDCFHNDTISIEVNGVPILTSTIAISDSSTGIAKCGFFQDKDSLFIQHYIVHALKRIDISKSLAMKITINNNLREPQVINLKKGKLIVIDYCQSATDRDKKRKIVSFSQYNKPIIFE